MNENPQTRADARANALEMMKKGHTATAEVWARIALTFPEDPDVQVLMADDRPAESPRAVLTHAGRSTDTIVVSSVAWDVMRTLAGQYVNTSLQRRAVVNLRDDFTIGISETDLVMSQVDDGVYEIMLVPRA